MSDPLSDLRAVAEYLYAKPPIPIALWVVDDQAAEFHIMCGLIDVSGAGIGNHNAQLYAIKVMAWRSIGATEQDRAWMQRHGPAALLDAPAGLYFEMNKGPVISFGQRTAAECYEVGRQLALNVRHLLY